MSFTDNAKFDTITIPKTLINPGIFEIVEFIGSGGFGTVWKVKTGDNKYYALKVFGEDNHQSRYLLEIEKKNMEALSSYPNCNPNIACYIDGFNFEADGKYYIAMLSEFVEGVNLADYVKTNNPLTPQEAIVFLKWIVPVLQDLHQKGFVHRDVKPQNIMITPDRHYKLIDFGVSCSFQDQPQGIQCRFDGLGTPGFKPPEIAQQGSLNAVDILIGYRQLLAADVFMLGVTLYYILFRTLPYPNPVSPTDLGLYDKKETGDKKLDQILDGLLDPNYEERLSLGQIMEILNS